MQKRLFLRRAAAPAALSCALVLTALVARASDHEDAPSLVEDRGADIADVYAFVRPGGTTHLVLAMTVHPGADTTTTFDEKVEYVFHVFGYDPSIGGYINPGVLQAQVACRFASADAGPQTMLCSVNGVAKEGALGSGDAGADTAPIRMFAGLRADPDFADIAALQSTVATGTLKLTASGTNAYAGKNVLAIVVEVNIADVLLAGTTATALGSRPLLAVSASTERLP